MNIFRSWFGFVVLWFVNTVTRLVLLIPSERFQRLTFLPLGRLVRAVNRSNVAALRPDQVAEIEEEMCQVTRRTFTIQLRAEARDELETGLAELFSILGEGWREKVRVIPPPEISPGETRVVRLISCWGVTTREQALWRLDNMRCRPARIEEALAFLWYCPDEVKKSFIVVVTGTELHVEGEKPWFPAFTPRVEGWAFEAVAEFTEVQHLLPYPLLLGVEEGERSKDALGPSGL